MSEMVAVFPDIERLVVDTLAASPGLSGVVVDNRVPPGFDATTRAVLVSRAGGIWVDDEHLDHPVVDLEVYGPDKPTAHTVSLTARALALGLRGVVYGGAAVLDVVEQDGPRWLPDYVRPNVNRYLFTVRLSVRPA
jgi:hypothetical protein